jgi:hypothetical protein
MPRSGNASSDNSFITTDTQAARHDGSNVGAVFALTMRMKTTRVEITPGELAPDGAAIVVAAADAGSTPTERYRHGARPGTPLLAGAPLVALVRSGPLSTSDTCEVSESSGNRTAFRLTLDVRRYTGPISANVDREFLFEVDLGAPSPGRYAVVVTTTALEFQDRQHPDRTANPSKTEERLELEVL